MIVFSLILSIPILLLALIFIGIVKKNKRLWIASLIGFLISTTLLLSYFMTVGSIN